jgi:hypothetical protein
LLEKRNKILVLKSEIVFLEELVRRYLKMFLMLILYDHLDDDDDNEHQFKRVVSHIQNFGDLLKEMPHLPRETRNLFQETRSFSTGDVSSPLEMHIPRTHTHISRSK